MPFVKAGEVKSKSIKGNTSLKRGYEINDEDEDEDEDDALAQMKQAKSGKKRHMDSFLEEIKKVQENRAKGIDAPAKSVSNDNGPYDSDDLFTTNIFLSNINPSVNENMLCQQFGKFGPIGSVKIMWPCTAEEIERNRNCGFVSFMEREHAAKALEELNGKDFHGYTIKAGWGKPVPLPSRPIFVLEKPNDQPKFDELPFNAQLVDCGDNKKRPEIIVVQPTDINTIKIIHRLIERIVVYGPLFEELIIERESNNKQYEFLFNNLHPDHIYYRWRLFSILQGDTNLNWRTEPFQMFEGGPWWIPPNVPDIPFDEEGTTELVFDSEDEANERVQQKLPKGQLGKIGRQRFETMVRLVTYQRGTIAQAMAYAIEHADAYEEIIDIIYKSLMTPKAPITSKIARLFLISDILHNSSVHVTNAWRYRDGFERCLPEIFEHLNEIFRSITARLKAEQFRRYITSVLGAWENWMVFPKHFIEKLNEIFMKKSDQNLKQPTLSDSGIKVNEDNNLEDQENDLDGEAMDDVDGEAMDDVDGEAMDDIDGEAMDDF
ncbi:hypothetical protein BJ944DRAFT_268929 [Cunninghamella echinulata]|nr:hypothetical protein BJ944DRAFT_268929 [Cunninghamella echinulata]